MKVEFEDIINTDEETIELVRNWRNSDDIRKYMYNDYIITKTEHHNWLKKLQTEDTNKAWLIKYEKKPVGLIYLSNIDKKNRITDWGFYIADESARGKGVGSKSLEKLINYVFDEMDFNTMQTKVLGNNPLAIKLYEKFGFKRDKSFKDNLLRDGKNIDVYLMSILKKERDKNKPTNP
jgi:UDP-4-amino-4,6-dideoxy-N-acetyl-beta-L-altrosamine N-acetyltransferase